MSDDVFAFFFLILYLSMKCRFDIAHLTYSAVASFLFSVLSFNIVILHFINSGLIL